MKRPNLIKRALIFFLTLLTLTAISCSEPFEPKLSGSLVGFSHVTEEELAAIREKGVIGLEDASALDSISIEKGYNITFSSIRASMGAELYKFASNNLTLLSLNGNFYKLGDANNGYGVISVLEHDLDRDGISELYFTYCTGEANKGRVGCYVQATASVLLCETEFDTPLLTVVTGRGGLDLYSATVDYGRFSTENINSQVDAIEKIASLTLKDGALTVK